MIGITASQLVKSIVLKNLDNFSFSDDVVDMEQILAELESNFHAIKNEEEFMVSDLVDDKKLWKQLSRGQKMMCSLKLKTLTEKHPNCIVDHLENKTKVYKKCDKKGE